MHARRLSAWLILAASLAAPALLAACGGDDTPPQTFAPLTYAYLRPLKLNVGAIDVRVDWAPGPRDVSGQSPVAPVDALQQMARDRLVPAGASGRAVFTVTGASIDDTDGTLSGLLKIRLDIYTSDGQRAAYAEAAVARTAPAPDSDDTNAMRAALYGLTQQMMSDMNVELEFQMRRSLGDWMQTAYGTAPPPPPVQQESLAPPGAASTTTPEYPPGTQFRLVPSAPPGSTP
jgi:hypothetical protein